MRSRRAWPWAGCHGGKCWAVKQRLKYTFPVVSHVAIRRNDADRSMIYRMVIFPKCECLANLWLFIRNPNREVASLRRSVLPNRMSPEHGESMQAKALGIFCGQVKPGTVTEGCLAPKIRNIFCVYSTQPIWGVNSGKLSGRNMLSPLCM